MKKESGEPSSLISTLKMHEIGPGKSKGESRFIDKDNHLNIGNDRRGLFDLFQPL